MATKLRNLKLLPLLHNMLDELNPEHVDTQGNQKTIYRFEGGACVLSVHGSTGSCQFQGTRGENSEMAKKIINIIEALNQNMGD